jgi:hypothetical protein
MVILVFLLFVAMFAVAGFYISLEAKRRNEGYARRPSVPRNDAPKMVRSTSDRQHEQGRGARAA